MVGFKKIKFWTNENVGAGDLQMPENQMHTTSYWLTIPRELLQGLLYTSEEKRDGVVGLSYVMSRLAALFLLCDRRDLAVAVGDNAQGEARVERGMRRLPVALRREREFLPGDDYEPNVFLYEDGVERLHRVRGAALRSL